MNFKNLIFISLITAFLPACNNDLLETVPNDRLSSEIFWKTENDAKLASTAVYTCLEAAASYLSWDGMTDIGHSNSATSIDALIARGQFDGTFARILSEWTSSYKGIQTANRFLKNIDRVQSSNPAVIAQLKGEVMTLRALFYTKLVMLYGDVPLIVDEITLSESRSLVRTPVEQIWDFISSELTQAAEMLPLKQAEVGRVTKGAALALKSRAMLYARRYESAAAAAKQVMDLGVYKLYPSYETLFSYAAENNEEVILDVQYIKNSRNHNGFYLIGPWSQNNSISAYVPTKVLVDAYAMKNGKHISDPSSGFDPKQPYLNRDPRLKYTVFTLGDKLPNGQTYNSLPGNGTADAIDFSWYSTKTGFNIKKYVNADDLSQPQNSGINLILIRYADVLLMYAEAKIESNAIDASVLDAINMIRQRPDVSMPPLEGSFTQSELRTIVRNERTIELAFEGLRYFDLRRWKTAEHVIPGTVYGMTWYENNTPHTVEVEAYQRVFDASKDYLWPVPQREIELNPHLTQNPNW